MNVTSEHTDTLVLGLPPGHEAPEDPANDKDLTNAAIQAVAMQFQDAAVRPVAIAVTEIDWVLASDHDAVDTFVPRHDCPTCATAISEAHRFLDLNPGGTAAMGNVIYTCLTPVYGQSES